MKEELDDELDTLPFHVQLDSLVGGTENLSFDQDALSVDLSKNWSL